MKTTALFTAFLLCSPLLAQGTDTPNAAPTPAVEMTEQAQHHLQLSRNILQVLRELTGTLQTVKDRDSADAAAVKVQEIADKMQELQVQAESYPTLSKEQEALVKASINKQEVQDTVHNFLVSVVQVAQVNCYESDSMSKALSGVLNKATKTPEETTN